MKFTLPLIGVIALFTTVALAKDKDNVEIANCEPCHDHYWLCYTVSTNPYSEALHVQSNVTNHTQQQCSGQEDLKHLNARCRGMCKAKIEQGMEHCVLYQCKMGLGKWGEERWHHHGP